MSMRSGHVAVLMATYNGAVWLQAQLDSLLAQDHGDWSLWVSDDGSRDGTQDILERFAEAHADRRIEVMDGPGQGPTRNFLELCAAAGQADAYAFCDQDDVWLPHRLSHGLALLRAAQEDGPVLVGHRTQIVSEDLQDQGLSPLFRRRPSFGNALVQSIAGGNTMLLNPAAMDLLRAAGPELDVVTHDWWAYQLVAGAGGRVIYDPRPALLYRQHGGNLIGSNAGWRARLVRIQALFRARFHQWNSRNLAALEASDALLTAEARAQVAAFRAVRQRTGIKAMLALARSGLVRQTTLGTLSLYAAAALGKL